MMKRLLLILFLLFSALTLSALRCGDDVVELSQVKWLRGNPRSMMLKHNKERRREYSIAVFMLTNTPDAVETLRILDQLAQRYAKMVQISVITPDAEQDAQTLLSKIHTPHLAFGIDSSRQLTARYMGGSMFFPMAFVAGQMRTIEWSGEVIDLAELLAETEKNPIDTDKYEKLAPLLDELQMLMRSNDNRKMRLFTSRVFKLDPGNAAALRMRLFYLENTGRFDEAWETLHSQLAAAPQKVRLYYTALDMLSRYPRFAGKLPEIIRQFIQYINDPDACDHMIRQLLSRFDFNPDALDAAVKLYEKSRDASLKLRRSPAALAGHYSAGALLAARLGNLPQAIDLQKKTVRCWQEAKNPAAADSAEKIAEYFNLCNKTRIKW